MRSIFCSLVLLGAVGLANAQVVPVNRPAHPTKFRILHADPWMIKALLEGQSIRMPEISTILSIAGMGQGAANAASQAAGQAANAAFSGGTLVVNPTDNSLWFYPTRS